MNTNQAVDFVSKLNEGFPLIKISPSISQFGYYADQLSKDQKPLIELIHPEDRKRVLNEIDSFLSDGCLDFEQEFRLLTPQGEERLIIAHSWIDPDTTGKVKYLQGILVDIGKREPLHKRNNGANQFFESLFKKKHVLLAFLDHNLTILKVNNAFSDTMGKLKQFYLGKNITDVFPGIADPMFFKETLASGETKIIHDKPLILDHSQDLSTKYWDWLVHPITIDSDGQPGFLLTMVDVTNRVAAVREKWVHQQNITRTLDNIPDGIYIINKEYDVEYANPVIVDEHGPVDHRKCFSYIHGRDTICPNCVLDRVLKGEVVRKEEHYSEIMKIYDSVDIPITNTNGTISKLKIMHDITKRKENEENLNHSISELKIIAEKEKEQRKLAEALTKASDSLSSTLNLDEILYLILEQIRRVVPFTAASIQLVKSDLISIEKNFSISFSSTTGSKLKDIFPGAEDANTKFLFDSKKPVSINNVKKDPRTNVYPGWEWVNSYISIPLLVKSQTIGFMQMISDKTDFFTDEVTKFLLAFAAQASIAVNNVWLFEKLRDANKQLQILSHHQTKILEDERQFIARELHDEAGQALTCLRLNIDQIEKNIDDTEFVLEQMKSLDQSILNISENLHNIAMSLRPLTLDHLGLIPAINQYTSTIQKLNGTNINFIHEGFERRLPNNIETIIYRVIQEALTNIVRHAHASSASIKLKMEDYKVTVIIQDDGVGFDTTVSPTRTHIGLLGMKERLNMINGKLSIDSQHNIGTTVTIEVPYGHSLNDR
jgi:signal transduction histidine kinase/PAS domain-containing protein